MYSYSPTDSSRSISSPESPSSSSTHYVWPVPASSSSHHHRRTAPSPYYYYNSHNHSHTTSTSTTTSTASSVKSRRFYSSPLCEDSPDPKTPLQAYGLEQREPSTYELQLQQQQQARPTPRLIHRMSTVLDDIKEDFHMQIDAHAAHDKQRLRRRESAFFDGPPVMRAGAGGAGAGAGDSSPPLPPVSAVPPVEESTSAAPAPGVASRRRESGARPLSVLSWENTWSLSRRFSRRLSMLGTSFSTMRRKRMEASISQPNLIGSSTQM